MTKQTESSRFKSAMRKILTVSKAESDAAIKEEKRKRSALRKAS